MSIQFPQIETKQSFLFQVMHKVLAVVHIRVKFLFNGYVRNSMEY